VVILPGGFSHGDYLRTGAIARFSPIMTAVADFARRGGPPDPQRLPVLLEAGLLPNDAEQPREVSLRAYLRAYRQTGTPFTQGASRGQSEALIAHGEGTTSRTRRLTHSTERARQTVLRRRRTSPQPERIAQQHRRHLQRGAQRRRVDAASRARV
jgi:phosphoribosylformylglycinamidine synthase